MRHLVEDLNRLSESQPYELPLGPLDYADRDVQDALLDDIRDAVDLEDAIGTELWGVRFSAKTLRLDLEADWEQADDGYTPREGFASLKGELSKSKSLRDVLYTYGLEYDGASMVHVSKQAGEIISAVFRIQLKKMR